MAATGTRAGAGAGGTWDPGRRRLTVGLVAAITLVALESLSVATVLPVIGRQLGDITLYGWVFSAFFLTSLIGIVAAGRLADRRGPALPMAVGLAVFAAGLVIGGLAPGMPVLVAGRAVQGLGAGAVPAAAYTAIGRVYAPGARPRMFATLSTAWVAPAVIGPTVAAVVADGPGWRWVFLGLVPAVGLAAVTCVPALADVPPPSGHDAGPRRARQAAGSTGLVPSCVVAAGAGLTLAGCSASAWQAAAPLVVVGALVCVAGLRHLVPAGTFRAAAGLPAAVATRGLLTFGYFAVDAYVPLTVTSVRHQSTALGGLALTAATFTWTSGAWVQARLLRSAGPCRLVRAGTAVLVVGVALLATVLEPSVPAWVAVAAWAVGGLGMGLAYSPLSVTALDRARPGAEGRASASLQLTDTLGTALGTGVGGAAVALGHRSGWAPRDGLGVAFALAAGVLVVGLAATTGLPRSLRSPAEGAGEAGGPTDAARAEV